MTTKKPSPRVPPEFYIVWTATVNVPWIQEVRSLLEVATDLYEFNCRHFHNVQLWHYPPNAKPKRLK